MFLSHEKSPSKMKFQKPNILRKRPKSTALSSVTESTSKFTQTLVSHSQINIIGKPDWNVEEFSKHKCSKQTHFTKKSLSRIKLESYISEGNHQVERNKSDVNGLARFNKDEKCAVYLDINKGTNSSTILGDCAFNTETITLKETKGVLKQASEWCFMPISSEQHDKSQVDDSSALNESADTLVVTFDVENGSQPKTFACEAAGCNKQFPNKQRLKRHNTTHNKSAINCPANKPHGTVLCGEVFTMREHLLKHLKEQHTLEDAIHRCERCSRRFFWVTGLQTHVRACGGALGRGVLACPWPGCDRVFQQPCRLKEHSRAHTGDKPYPCHYPNCNWSFRTASKLLRHARRHTGERRHPCEQCGRAFLRREHLRDHVARHLRPSKRLAANNTKQRRHPRNNKHKPVERMLAQPVDDTTESSEAVEPPLVCVQLKSQVLSEELTVTKAVVTSPVKLVSDWSDGEDPFFVRTAAPPTLSSRAAALVSEERSARTHCTWPLARTSPAPSPSPASPSLSPSPNPASPAAAELYVLTDEAQVELAEAAETESKIYTIRSDLFLHGNVIHSEDSESGVAVIATAAGGAGGGEVPCDVTAAGEGGAGQGAALDTELGLIDATSAIDLMQEELMYTAAASDEPNYHLLSDGEYHYWLAT